MALGRPKSPDIKLNNTLARFRQWNAKAIYGSDFVYHTQPLATSRLFDPATDKHAAACFAFAREISEQQDGYPEPETMLFQRNWEGIAEYVAVRVNPLHVIRLEAVGRGAPKPKRVSRERVNKRKRK